MSETRSVYVPLTITLVALVIFEAAQTIAIFNDHGALTSVRDSQNTAVQQSQNMRNQMTTLAGKIALLAQSGDADAQQIVNDFAKNGIKFSPPTGAGAPAAAAPAGNNSSAPAQ